MARLPKPGSDNGTWGNILNDYLSQTHTADGTLKDNIVGTAQLQDNAVTTSTIADNAVTTAAIADNAVTTSALAPDAVTNAEIADGTIQEAQLATPVQTKLNQAAPTWSTLSGKPAVVAAGADQAAARTAIEAVGKGELVVNVQDYGAVGDGVADDTSAIQAAIDSGLPIWVPPGTYLVSGLTLIGGSAIHGAGIGKTIFKHKANSTAPCMRMATAYSGNLNLSGFTIDGNKANQTVPLIGLDLDNTGSAENHRANSPFGNDGHDPRHAISDIMMWRCSGSGFRQQGRGAGFFSRLWTMECAGHGFEILGFDSLYEQLDSGASGLCGIYIGPAAANNRFSVIKSWYSGQVDRVTYGQGILLDGSRLNQFSSVEIQNSGSDGIKLKSASHNMFASTAIEFPPNPANPCDGLVIDDSSSTVGDFVIIDRGTLPYSLRYGVVLRKTTTGCYSNHITANVSNAGSGIASNQGGQSYNDNYMALNGARFIYQTRTNWGYLPQFADDAAAATGGLSVGDVYFSTTVNAFTKRRA